MARGPLTCCCHWWSSLRPHPLLCSRRVPGGHRTVYIDVNLPELPPRNMASQVGVFARNELPVTVSSPRLVNETRRLPQGSSNFSPTFLCSTLDNSATANRMEALSEAQSQVQHSNFGLEVTEYPSFDLLLHPVADDLIMHSRASGQMNINDQDAIITAAISGPQDSKNIKTSLP